MKKYLFIISISLLISCSPQERMSRLIRRHPELIHRDTVVFSDTLITKLEKIDTLWTIQDRPVVAETLFIEKDRIKLQLIHHYDSIRIYGQLPSDTVIIHRAIPVDRVVVQKSTLWMCFKRLSPFLLVLLFLIVLVRFILQKW